MPVTTPALRFLFLIHTLVCVVRAQQQPHPAPQVEFWGRINVQHIEYNPTLAKHIHPPMIAGQQWKGTSDEAKGNMAGYFRWTQGRTPAGRMAPPFKV